MECAACTRSDPSRLFYCSACLTARLAEHQARKHQIRNALTLETNRASNLLAHGPPPAPPARQSVPFGVRDESVLKADRWTLSVKLRDTRIATELDKTRIQNRKLCSPSLASIPLSTFPLTRSSHHSHGRARSASICHRVPPNKPLERAIIAVVHDLETSFATLSSSLYQVRKILTLELLTTFSFKTIEPPLADPFILYPVSASTRSTPSTPFPPSYSLATVPLPSLSLLPTLPVQSLEALLVNLLHLTRLLALYEGVSLPFTPLPSAFGPGRAGIKPTPAWAISSSSSESSRMTDSKWPLMFGIHDRKGTTSRNRDGQEEDGTEFAAFERTTDRSSTSTTKSTTTTSSASISTKRFKSVMTGAIALAFDLAYICWIRENRDPANQVEQEWQITDLEDLGKLILRASGAESDKDQDERKKRINTSSDSVDDALDPFPRSIDTLRPTNPEPSPSLPSSFPLNFTPIVSHYLSLAFPTTSPASKKRSKKKDSSTIGRGTHLGQSSYVDATYSTSCSRTTSRGQALEDDEEEEEEEWDFV
ncbi:uncharacterized protein JCM15063_003117 [Sporobolomyces koalae]|uniref:uncharacterized protein n=1 Tax=Sporobolomyces koalae TaxID=500713 RepID=UPI00317A630C